MPEPRSTEGRVEPRVQIELQGANMRESGWTRAPVTVHDLSRSGFRTEWPYRLTQGAQVWLSLPGLGARSAKVAWVRNFEVGCKFDEPLHPAVFDRIVSTVL